MKLFLTILFALSTSAALGAVCLGGLGLINGAHAFWGFVGSLIISGTCWEQIAIRDGHPASVERSQDEIENDDEDA